MSRRGCIAVALALAAAGGSAHGPPDARAGEVRTQLSVTATVVERVGFHVVNQARELTITAEDIERGYVEVRNATRLAIDAPRPCTLEFRSTGSLVESVRVTGSAMRVEFGAEGAAIAQSKSHAGRPIELSYVFMLARDAKAGRHPWPVMLTVYPQ